MWTSVNQPQLGGELKPIDKKWAMHIIQNNLIFKSKYPVSSTYDNMRSSLLKCANLKREGG